MSSTFTKAIIQIQCEFCENVDDISTERFSTEVCEDDLTTPQSKTKRLRERCSGFLTCLRKIGTSWKLWTLLFIIALIIIGLGLIYHFMIQFTTNENFQTTVLQMTSSTTKTTEITETTIDNSSTLKTTTDSFPSPV